MRDRALFTFEAFRLGACWKADATREEVAEVALIAAAVRAGGTLGHALLARRLFDRHKGEG